MGTARKPVVLTMSALGAITLLSVGFASWEIRNTSASISGEGGSISADTVVDKRLRLVGTGSWQSDKNVIYFGANTSFPTDSSSYGWLDFSGNESTENLSAVYTFDVACPTDKVTNNACPLDIKFSDIDVSGTNTAAWSSAVSEGDNNLINGKPTINGAFAVSTNAWNSDDYSGMTIYTCTVTVTFSWGSKFSSSNPYVYYNEKSYTESLASEALSALKAVSEAASCVTEFHFTITVSFKNETV